MGHTLSTTSFVSEDAQADNPSCHVLGSPDLYGLGIRLAFYLQYLAFTLALVTGSTSSLPSLRTGLAILTVTLFVTLCTTTTSDTLVVLDWFVITALAGPFVFLTDVFVRAAAARAYLARRREIPVSVNDLLGGDHPPSAAGPSNPTQRSLLESALSTYRAHHALVDGAGGPPDEDTLSTLRHALVDFGRAARDSPDVAARYTLRGVSRATDIQRACSPLDRARFDADLLQAALGTGMTHTEAQRVVTLAAASTAREAASARSRETLLQVRERMCAARPRDLLAVSLVCVAWAAFQLARPWLYWKAIDRGMRDGCDVRLMWVFVPVSVESDAFRVWLRAWAVVMFVAGAAGFAYGGVVLATNMFAAGRWDDGCEGGGVRASDDVESQTALLRETSIPPADGSSSMYSYEADGRCGRRRKTPGGERRCRTYFRWIAAAQFSALAVTVCMAEGTILANGIDMEGGDLRTESQIFALVIGLVTSVPVYWECLVIVPLRWMARRRQEKAADGECGRSLRGWWAREEEVSPEMRPVYC